MLGCITLVEDELEDKELELGPIAVQVLSPSRSWVLGGQTQRVLVVAVRILLPGQAESEEDVEDGEVEEAIELVTEVVELLELDELDVVPPIKAILQPGPQSPNTSERLQLSGSVDVNPIRRLYFSLPAVFNRVTPEPSLRTDS